MATQFSQTDSITQPDGKVVIAGNMILPPTAATPDLYVTAVARYNADGSIDTTFGTGGYFYTAMLAESIGTGISYQDGARGIALQPDGKILLATNIEGVAEVARIDADGTLDATFGTGGIVALGNLIPGSSQASILNYASSVAVLSSGQIVVGGSVLVNSTYEPAVERLNADGSVDSTYGTAGLAAIPAPTTPAGTTWLTDSATISQVQQEVLAQPDGKVIIQGFAVVQTSSGSAGLTGATVFNRLNADGTLDSSFGTGGQELVAAPAPNPQLKYIGGDVLALQPDGKLIVGGDSVSGVLVARLDADGSPDPTFGVGGFNILPASYQIQDNEDSPIALALQPDGKILLGGSNNHAMVIRLDTDGLPDLSFGEGGRAVLPLADNQPAAGVNALSVLADGKILVVGSGYTTRLLASGSAGDYNDDGVSDPAVLITTPSIFAAQFSGGGGVSSGEITQFGTSGAGLTLPAPGAYNGGGISELAVYLPALGAFAVRPYNGGPDVITAFGTPGLGNSLPAPGDYDHSGQTEYAVYLPSLGEFAYRPANGGPDVFVGLGLRGAGQSIPAPADYFGTGQTDFAVYLVSEGAYEIMNPVTGAIYNIPFGTPGAGQSIPVPGDYDGSGHAELAVYVPASGDLIYRPYSGGADVVVPIGTPGIAQSIPAIGDYDGSGHDEAAVYEPATATLLYLPASGGPEVSISLGTAGGTLPFSMGTNSVAESGLGSSSGSPDFIAEAAAGVASVEVPLTPDVLDSIAGTPAKKTAKPA